MKQGTNRCEIDYLKLTPWNLLFKVKALNSDSREDSQPLILSNIVTSSLNFWFSVLDGDFTSFSLSIKRIMDLSYIKLHDNLPSFNNTFNSVAVQYSEPRLIFRHKAHSLTFNTTTRGVLRQQDFLSKHPSKMCSSNYLGPENVLFSNIADTDYCCSVSHTILCHFI